MNFSGNFGFLEAVTASIFSSRYSQHVICCFFCAKIQKYAIFDDMTPEDIKNLAHLARIEVNDAEIASFGAEMESILGYVDQINQLEISEIDQQFTQVNQVRSDVVQSFDGVSLLDQAPDQQDGFYKVPKIL